MRNLRAVTETAPRAIIYLRQSIHREESISLELQEIACRDYCDRAGYTVVGVEADPGISGRTWNRPAVQRTMAAIENGTADVVILWKWSRLSRSRKDWALAIDRADIAGGKIESATEPIDTATASGRFARGVMTEYAAFQSEQIGEQWEEVRQRRLKLGLPASGRLPFGWRWVEGGGIEADPEQAPVVVDMYTRYLAGDGSALIAKWLNDRGIPAPNGGAWRRARPLTVMDSPVHAGFIPYRGNTYNGQHEPIIDAETWAAYQSERQRRRETGAKPREYAHLLSNLMICGCGARMHGKGSVTGGKLYRGYMCGDLHQAHEGRAYVSALTVEPLVVDWLMAFDPEVDTTRDVTSQRARLDAVTREQNALEVELVTLTRQHTRGVIPEAAYVRASAEIEAELHRLRQEERQLAAMSRAVPGREQLATLRRTWLEATMPEQNRALRQVVASLRILNEAASRFEITTTWGSSSVLSR